MTKNSQNSPRPKLSLITVNYNGIKDTLELLDSIYSTIRSVTFEVIVVDNCSADKGEIGIITQKYPMVKALRSESNRGFAGGNNLGIDIAEGEFIMLINNDTLIPSDHFAPLLERFDKNPEAGALSPKILFASPEGTIQFAGYTQLSPITLRNSLIGFLEPDDGRYCEAAPTPYCHGAAFIFRREVIERIGKMSEVYFLYYEELDWSQMIRDGGYELWYDPSQSIIHKESSTIGAASPVKAYYMTRNRLLFSYRRLKGYNRFLSILYQLIVSIPKGVFVYLLNGKKENSAASLRGAADFFRIKNKNA